MTSLSVSSTQAVLLYVFCHRYSSLRISQRTPSHCVLFSRWCTTGSFVDSAGNGQGVYYSDLVITACCAKSARLGKKSACTVDRLLSSRGESNFLYDT